MTFRWWFTCWWLIEHTTTEEDAYTSVFSVESGGTTFVSVCWSSGRRSESRLNKKQNIQNKRCLWSTVKLGHESIQQTNNNNWHLIVGVLMIVDGLWWMCNPHYFLPAVSSYVLTSVFSISFRLFVLNVSFSLPAQSFQLRHDICTDAHLFRKPSIKRILVFLLVGVVARLQSAQPLVPERADMKRFAVNIGIFIVWDVCV